MSSFFKIKSDFAMQSEICQFNFPSEPVQQGYHYCKDKKNCKSAHENQWGQPDDLVHQVV